MRGPARAAAARLLERNVETLEREGGVPFAAQMVAHGRVFGGSYALEVATAEPVLPPTRGLRARGRGLVRLERVVFRAETGDTAGESLASRLNGDEALQRALARVHFERVRVDPDGRAVIRQMGGSVVWILFPPLVRPVPLVDEQARATLDALDRFARVGTTST